MFEGRGGAQTGCGRSAVTGPRSVRCSRSAEGEATRTLPPQVVAYSASPDRPNTDRIEQWHDARRRSIRPDGSPRALGQLWLGLLLAKVATDRPKEEARRPPLQTALYPRAARSTNNSPRSPASLATTAQASHYVLCVTGEQPRRLPRRFRRLATVRNGSESLLDTIHDIQHTNHHARSGRYARRYLQGWTLR